MCIVCYVHRALKFTACIYRYRMLLGSFVPKLRRNSAFRLKRSRLSVCLSVCLCVCIVNYWSDAVHGGGMCSGDAGSLKISSVRKFDAGTYLCRANNSVGQSPQTRVVSVDVLGLAISRI